MRKPLCTGIFMWDGPERHSQRYGWIFAGDSTFENGSPCKPTFDKRKAKRLQGKNVKLSVKIIQSRKSGHMGDLYLNILPSQPKVGDIFTLGIGTFNTQNNPFQPEVTDIAVRPNDGRTKYWLDPNILYKLHDQSVEIYAEVSKLPPHKAPNIIPVKPARCAISNGDGSIQIVGVDLEGRKTIRIKPKVERLGQGLFSMSMPNAEGNRGETFELG